MKNFYLTILLIEYKSSIIKQNKIISHKYPPSIIGNLKDLFICWGHNTAGNITNLQKIKMYYIMIIVI